jgi:NAD(P)-dependent dehydrogenase (short-subunit alcohol dehydrogenase family)
MKNWFDLSDTITIVAGSEGLLGKSVAGALEDSGGTVVAIDLKGKAESVNVADENDLAGFFKELESYRDEGKSWAFVNCSYPRTENWGQLGFDNVKMTDWNRNIELHLGSAFHFTQEAVKFLQRKGGGSIVNFGSIYGLVGPDMAIYEGTKMVNGVTYAAIKSGITGLTRYVATVFGRENIRANVVCPGGIKDNQPESFIKAYNKRTPLGRMGTSEDVAGVVAFLISPAAKYITGQTIAVDGGWTAW